MIIEVLILLISVIIITYLFYKHKFSYWRNLGVPYIKPRIPFGNIQGFRRKYHSSQIFPKFYAELKSQSKVGFGGIYFFTNPVIFATDLNFLKLVLVKDFNYFHDRGFFYNEKDDPLSAHLLAIEGEKWKFLREKMRPTFTSGKLKMMFPIMVEVAERLNSVLEETIETTPELEMKTFLARFTTDIIGSCAFGIDCNCLKNPDAEFLQMGLKAFLPRNSPFKQTIIFTLPKLARKLRFKSVRDDVSTFFMKVVSDVIKHREENSVQRNDFMNLLLQLKNNGSIDGIDDSNKFTFEQVAAQAFVFFLAGYETSSTTMTFCLHELSQNLDIQEKARQNVRDVLERYDGEITYEALQEMTYLEQCINEALRKYPPGSNLVRNATNDYKVPGTDIVIKKGQTVFVSLYAIHHDAEYFPDPEKYDPERFSQKEIDKRSKLPFTPFLPFGEGPRNCIGLRFGMLETKLGLATILANYHITKSDKTKLPLQFSKNSIVLTPEGGLFMKLEKI